MFEIIILLISFVGYFLFFTSIAKFKIGQAPLLSITAVTIIVYLFAITDKLVLGAEVALWLGISLFVISLLLIVKLPKKEFNFNLFDLVYFIPFFVLYRAIDKNYLFTGWDEFSFWASSIKVIFETGSLYTLDTSIHPSFKAYPPLQQILQFYVLHSTSWSEPVILFTQGVFLISCTSFCFSTITKKTSLYSSIAFLSSLCLMYYFDYGFRNIYVDQLVALHFSALLSISFCLQKKRDFFCFLALAFNMVLVKQIGLVFSLYCATIFAILHIASFYLKDGINKNTKFKTNDALLLLCPYILIIMAFCSWYLYLHFSGLQIRSAAPILHDTDEWKYRTAETFKQFFYRIEKPGYLIYADRQQWLSMTWFTALITLMSCVCIVLTKGVNKTRIAIASILLLAMWLVYVGFLLLCYFLYFSEYEAIRLASFERYTASFALGWLVFIWATIPQLIRGRYLKVLYFVLPMTALYFTQNQFYKDIHKISSDEKFIDARIKINEYVDALRSVIKPGDKVYFIIQNSSGFEKYMFNYAMQPYKTLWWCWSLGAKYSKDDVWTCNNTIEQAAKDYNYVVIYRGDEQFWHNNKRFTSGETGNGIYKVDKDISHFKMIKIK